VIPAACRSESPAEFYAENGVYPVLDYVASGTDPVDVRRGLVDATDAIQAAAADAIAEGGVLLFPSAARLRYSDLLFHALTPVAAVGGPWSSTKLIPDPSYNGPAMIFEDIYRNGEGQVNDLTVDLDVWKIAAVVEGLTFVSEDWSDEHHGVWFVGRTDLAYVAHTYFMLMRGVALSICAAGSSTNDFMRECYLNHLRFEQCGDWDGSGFAAATVNTKSGAGDGTNHLTWNQLEFVYNNGPFHIFNEAGASETERRLTINDLMLHGKGSAATAQAHDLMILEGRLLDVVVARMKTNSSSAGQFSVLIRADGNGDYPKQVAFPECSLSNAPGGGFHIERCGALTISGKSQGGAAVLENEVQVDSGALDGGVTIEIEAAPTFDTPRNIEIAADQWDLVSGIVGPVGNERKFEEIDPRGAPILHSIVGSTSSAIATIGGGAQANGTVSGASDTTLGWANNWVTSGGANADAGPNSTAQLFMPGASAQDVGAGCRFRVRGFRGPDASYNESGAGTGCRIFVGLSNQNVATSVGSDDPAGHRAGFQRISVNGGKTQTNWQISTKDNVTEDLVDTGVPFVAGNVYDLELALLPGSVGVWWRIIDWTAETITTGTTTDRLPGEGVALRMMAVLRSVNAVARNLQLVSLTARSLS
jgi:hypothetical protein